MFLSSYFYSNPTVAREDGWCAPKRGPPTLSRDYCTIAIASTAGSLTARKCLVCARGSSFESMGPNVFQDIAGAFTFTSARFYEGKTEKRTVRGASVLPFDGLSIELCDRKGKQRTIGHIPHLFTMKPSPAQPATLLLPGFRMPIAD